MVCIRNTDFPLRKIGLDVYVILTSTFQYQNQNVFFIIFYLYMNSLKI